MIGRRIRMMREARGWTQEELALRMGYKSKSTINKIEKDINDVNQTTINRFASVFGCDPIELMVSSYEIDRIEVPRQSARVILSNEEKIVIDLMRSDSDFKNSLIKYTKAVGPRPKVISVGAEGTPTVKLVKGSPKVAVIKAPKGSIVIKKNVGKTRGKRKEKT